MRLTIALAVVLTTAFSFTAAVRAEQVQFDSATYTGLRSFKDRPERTDTIKANLSIPSGSQKAAAVVVLHTCSGPGVTDRTISEHLRGAGFATLEFDSLAPRGWTSTQVCGGKIPASTWTQLGDAYAALAFLARHPAIDPARVAVTGASMGGGTAFLTSAEPLRASLMGKDGPRFAAHAAFFPGGSYAFFGPGAHTGAPVLLMLGMRDDWTPAKRVIAAADFLKKNDPNVRIDIRQYDAYHAWFGNAAKNFQKSRKSFADCPFTLFAADLSMSKLSVGGELTPLPMEEFRTMYRTCRTDGATTEGNPAAAAQSLADVVAFLRQATAR